MDSEIGQQINKIREKIKDLRLKARQEIILRKARTKALIVMGAWLEAQLLGRTDKPLWQYLEREGKIRLVTWALGVGEMNNKINTVFVSKGDLEKVKKLAEIELQKLRKDKTTLGEYLESRRELIQELLINGVTKKRVCEILSQDCGFTISVKRLNGFLGEGKKSKPKSNKSVSQTADRETGAVEK